MSSQKQDNIPQLLATTVLSWLKSPFLYLSILVPSLVITGLFRLSEKNAKTLHNFEKGLGYPILLTSFILLFLLLIFFLPNFVKYIRSRQPSRWMIILVLLFSSGFTIIAHKQVEACHRTQSDESMFLGQAQNAHNQGHAPACREAFFAPDASMEECLSEKSYFKGRTQGVLFSLLMPILGSKMQWIFDFQLFLFFLTCIAVAVATWLWTKNGMVAVATSAFLMINPTVLFQFRSASNEPLYIFLAASALIALNWALQSPSARLVPRLLQWIFLGLILGLLAQTRQESAAVIPAFFLASLVFFHKRKAEMFAFITTTTAAILPMLLTIFHYRNYNFQGGQHTAHSMNNFIHNMVENWQIMTKPPVNEMLTTPFLPAFTWLAIIGLAMAITRAIQESPIRKHIFFLAIYHLQTFVILYNVSGDFDIKINQRYSLVFLPTMAYFIGIFFDTLFNHIKPALQRNPDSSQKPHPYQTLFLSILCATIALSLTYQHRRSLNKNIMHNDIALPQEEAHLHDWMNERLFQKILEGKHQADLKTLDKTARKLIPDSLKIALGKLPPARLVQQLPRPERKQLAKKLRSGLEKNYEHFLVVYSRPLHFIGYAVSSISYDTWLRYDANKKKEILNKFNQEVYYARGMDCWDRKQAHSKVQEARSGHVCARLERENELQSVFRRSFPGAFDVVVSKLTGKKPINVPQELRVNRSKQTALKIANGEEVRESKDILKVNRLKVFPADIQGNLFFEFNSPKIRQSFSYQLSHFSRKNHLVLHERLDTLMGGILSVRVDIPGTPPQLIYQIFTGDSLIPLGRLPVKASTQGWATLQTNRSVDGNPLRIANREYLEGLGSHAPGRIDYELKGEYKYFSTYFGLDSEAVGGNGARFIVLADNKEIFRSEDIKPGSNLYFTGKLPIAGVQNLSLISEDLGNKDFDHTDWIFPVLEK